MLPAHYYWGLLSEPHISCSLFCVLYLHKLVTGLRNADHKWCEEKLDLCLSASICSFHFLYRSAATSETLVGGKTWEEKKATPFVSFSGLRATAQSHTHWNLYIYMCVCMCAWYVTWLKNIYYCCYILGSINQLTWSARAISITLELDNEFYNL